MKTSRNETCYIERYLDKELSEEETILFEAQLILDPVFKLNVALQKKVYALTRFYGRKKMKKEIEEIHRRLFESPAHVVFQQQVQQLFKDN